MTATPSAHAAHIFPPVSGTTLQRPARYTPIDFALPPVISAPLDTRVQATRSDVELAPGDLAGAS